MFSSNNFFLLIINLRILNFSQVWFSLRPIQVLECLGHSYHFLTPPTNNTAILLPTLIGKESASLEYVILLILSSKLNSNKFILLIIGIRILSW